MRGLFILPSALAAGIALASIPAAQAAVGEGTGAALHSISVAPVEAAQFIFGGQNYCWYPGGWRGPGWYWCGYAWRSGYGWGGGVGWNGWSSNGGGDRWRRQGTNRPVQTNMPNRQQGMNMPNNRQGGNTMHGPMHAGGGGPGAAGGAAGGGNHGAPAGGGGGQIVKP